MANKKSAKAPNNDAQPAPEQEALERRVEAMMNPRLPETAGSGPADQAVSDTSSAAPLDIFEGLKSAPEVPQELLKIIGHKPVPTKPSTAEPEAAAPAEAETKPEPVPEPEAPEKPETPEPPASQPEPAAETPTPNAPEVPVPPLAIDDSTSDAAVDEIVAKEGDDVLAAQDAAAGEYAVSPASAAPQRPKPRRTRRRISKKLLLWALPVVLLLAVFAYPASRYFLLGLAFKQSVTVTVTDSKTHTPVSSADVSFQGVDVKTNANGQAHLRVPVGNGSLQITKRYYQAASQAVPASLFGGAHTYQLTLVATGRQVPVTVINRITGKPLAGAEVSAARTSAKTDAKGNATIVLPTTGATQAATITAKGYNTAHNTVAVTADVVPENTIALTPSGTVYFLSNLSGKVDVVKANLDGTNRHTVLAGTGNEDAASTTLLASHDWRYVILRAKRTANKPALFVIDTQTDRTTQFDQTDGTYSLIGWSGHIFIYDIVRSATPASQTGHEAIKAFDAENEHLNQLDQTSAEGNTDSYAYQSFANFSLLPQQLLYTAQWSRGEGTDYDISSKKDVIRTVQPDGKNKKDLQSFASAQLGYIQAARTKPQTVLYAVNDYTTNKTNYYQYDNDTVSVSSTTTTSIMNKQYPSYLASPSGKQVFWTEPRDGKNSLFVGDDNAGNPQQLAALTDYTPFGWYSDQYLLVSKGGGELYVIPANAAPTNPLKVTDYFKPGEVIVEYGGL